jgi:glycosyltransferase involved in cell wall biosynthesis
MRIGCISTRLAGTDGVSLEATKLTTVLRGMGHQVFYCAGELDADGPPGELIPEMHFSAPEARWIHDHAFGTTFPHPDLQHRIEALAGFLHKALSDFIAEYEIDLIIPQNALTIPMHIPLGVALADLIEATSIPTIAHHHDFYWERERFLTNCICDILDRAFPPNLPTIRHMVINSLAQAELKRRRGIDAIVLPNVFDFDAPIPGMDDFNADLRQAIGLATEDLLILQPTRVVPRKGIELSLELVSRLRMPNAKLVITHAAGDEGLDYLYALMSRAQDMGVDLHYVADRFAPSREVAPDGRKTYALWDAYVHADLVTYPSFIEGFGNALIETIYFKLPALVNRYPVYAADIGPLGFDFVEIDGAITAEAVDQVRALLVDLQRRQQVVEHNFQLGGRHFSYQMLEMKLQPLLQQFTEARTTP